MALEENGVEGNNAEEMRNNKEHLNGLRVPCVREHVLSVRALLAKPIYLG